jgi:hypothetical protein
MNPNPDAATIGQALQVFYVIGGIMALLGVVKAVLDIAGFFRRQPPIDQTIAALVREFNEQLTQRVHVNEWRSCEARHAQQIRDVETRYTAEIRAMEARMDRRLEGLHESLVELRATTLASFKDVMKDLGYVAGSKADKGEG